MGNSYVYHYTSIDAFRNLIESVDKSKYKDSFLFRASNILYMNDPNEFYYGRRLFVRTLVEIENELGIDDNYRISSLWISKSYDDEQIKDVEYIHYLQKMQEIPYVLSFSLLKDSLPMWLNYGDGGRGVCLAFEDNRNQSLKHRKTNKGDVVYEDFYTSDVHYDIIDKDSWLYKMLCDIIADYKQNIQNGYSESMKDAYFDALIQYAAPFIKTSHYRNESEVRLSQTIRFHHIGEEKVSKFRCNKMGNLIPYIDVEINVNNLRYVILGPLVNYDLTKLALEMMADRFLPTKLEIKPSKVQYRVY